jgi:hypothetical protein
VSSASPPPAVRTFRLPRSAYLIVLFLVFCTVPLAFGTNQAHTAEDAARDSTTIAGVEFGPRALLLIIPIAAAFYIARTSTTVNEAGIKVRALLGTRQMRWAELRGLSVNERSVYAVCSDGSVRLPCVRIGDLAAVSQASAGRLPELPAPTPKFAPSRRPTRRARRR